MSEICSFKKVRINGFGYGYNLNAGSMKTNQETLKGSWLLLLAFFLPLMLHGQSVPADTSYLADVKDEMRKIWPESRTINLVFHGHSVPAGYWTNHEVHTLESYSHLVLKELKAKYPYAVINVIVTAIGGENSVKGETRMDKVLAHQPDVLFIDYALNDRSAGLPKAKAAWEKMIAAARERNIKVILLTASPDQRVDILQKGNDLQVHSEQIRQMAISNEVGLVDSFSLFQDIARREGSIISYMSHVNHPNKRGHDVIASEIMKWF